MFTSFFLLFSKWFRTWAGKKAVFIAHSGPGLSCDLIPFSPGHLLGESNVHRAHGHALGLSKEAEGMLLVLLGLATEQEPQDTPKAIPRRGPGRPPPRHRHRASTERSVKTNVLVDSCHTYMENPISKYGNTRINIFRFNSEPIQTGIDSFSSESERLSRREGTHTAWEAWPGVWLALC